MYVGNYIKKILFLSINSFILNYFFICMTGYIKRERKKKEITIGISLSFLESHFKAHHCKNREREKNSFKMKKK